MVAQQHVEVAPVVGIHEGRSARFARLDAALRRAIAANVDIFALPNGGYAVQSATDADRGYVVDANYVCQCKAAQNSMVCLHVALAMAMDGIIPWPQYDPEPDPAGPAAAMCRVCGGDGAIQHERLDPAPWTCPRCGGSGLEPVAPAA